MDSSARRRRAVALATPPWTRAPLLLWRQPGVVLAIVVATAILGVAGASAPLFLASAGSGGLAREIHDDCPEWPRPAVTNLDDTQNLWTSKVPENRTAVAATASDPAVRAAMRQQALPDPYRVLMTEVRLRGGSLTEPERITLYARGGALDQVDVVSRVDGHGLWVPDKFAGDAGLRAGDSVTLPGGPERVVAVYRDLARSNIGLPGYWCSWSSLIVPSFENSPPPFVLADDDTLLRQGAPVAAEWFSPVDSARLTVPDATEVSRRTHAMENSPLLWRQDAALPRLHSQTFVERDIARAVAGRDGLTGPVVPVAVAGTLVALLLVGAAGGYWAERRAAEVRLLTARGVRPSALGVKAVLEMLPAALVGLAAGWLAAIGLVRWFGPSSLLEPGAPVRALRTVALVGLGGLFLLGVVAAAASRGSTDRRSGGRGRFLRLLPWELALLGASVAAYVHVRDHGVHERLAFVQIPPMLVAFPLFALGGCLLLAARLAAGTLPTLRRWGGRLPTAGYLASRRLTARPAVTLALLVATAVPVGVLSYAATLGRSTDATVQAKIRANLGADHTVVTLLPPKRTPATGGHGTVVSVVQSVTVDDDTGAGVLGVDPATFARFAARGLASRPVEDLVRLLRPVPRGQPVPAILVNADPRAQVRQVTMGSTTVPVRVVDREAAFPGSRFGNHPTLVVRRDALRDVDFYAARVEEIWTTDDQVRALRDEVRRQHVPIFYERQPLNVLQAVDLVTVVWALGYLEALAVLSGLIAAAGLLLYLAARARSRVASYVLGQRMGVTRRAHLVSLVVEVGAVTGAGFALGLLVARVAVGLVNPLLDVNPFYPPSQRLAYPFGTLAWALVALVAVTAVCAAAAQRSADRTRPAAVMRLGG